MSNIKTMGNKIEIQMMIGIAILFFSVSMATDENVKRTYIVHMAKFDQMQATLDADVDEPRYFQSSLDSVGSAERPIYEYKNAINGYAARLTAEEAEALKVLPQVISVLADTMYELHTTRTPHFLGLDQQPSPLPNHQHLSNVIIGVLDTGVWPESDSFHDTGLGPVPSRWRGECENGTNFTPSMCNKKLIGARFFHKGYKMDQGDQMDLNAESLSPRDDNGHGTHTSTTAAGSPVSGASLLGFAKGTARGMAEYARVAAYKVCWKNGCFSSDILSAIDQAIEDKVDVLSLSLGGTTAAPYHNDSVTIGAFSAMERGIVVVCSAGNSGPAVSSVTNVAPWITTVGAGTLDRNFPAPVALGNGKIYTGASLYSGNQSSGGKLRRPFIYAGNAANDTTSGGNLCLPGTLLPEKVRGKIVLCDRGVSARASKCIVVNEAGGVGTIVANTASNGEELVVDAHLYLATAVGEKAGNEMKKYLSTDPNPTATISFQGTQLGVKPAPVVAAFSSRGPNTQSPEIIKPDLIAPGVNILAGWTENAGPSDIDIDTRRVPYNIISGTSMSCPHVSGLAALLKAAYPHWSPAAIRSALMTTAYSTYENGKPILDFATGKASTPFDLGAGHVKPLAALDPGLVYDLKASDYLDFLCATNKYSDEQMHAISRNNTFSCKYNKSSYSMGLNYPSFAVSIQAANNNQKGGNVSVSVKQKRTLTNVGPAGGTYNVSIISPSDSVKISVAPETLTFNGTYDKKSYTVTFKVNTNMPANTNEFGRIEWYDDKKHVVGSAIAVTWI